MSRRRFAAIVSAAIMLAVPATAAAPGTPAETIKARQANFKSMGRSMKLMSDELRKAAPSLAVIRREAAALEKAGARIGGFFPRGSGPQAGVKTEALASIWQRPTEFRAATADLNRAAQGLRITASGTDVGRIRGAFKIIGGTCKSCHDKFKAEE